LAPFFPRAARVLFGKCAIVLFRRAALAAFLMFRFAGGPLFSIRHNFTKLDLLNRILCCE
jgi:hypothetical protein